MDENQKKKKVKKERKWCRWRGVIQRGRSCEARRDEHWRSWWWCCGEWRQSWASGCPRERERALRRFMRRWQTWRRVAWRHRHRHRRQMRRRCGRAWRICASDCAWTRVCTRWWRALKCRGCTSWCKGVALWGRGMRARRSVWRRNQNSCLYSETANREKCFCIFCLE